MLAPALVGCASSSREDQLVALADGLTADLLAGDEAGFRAWFSNDTLAERWAAGLPAYSEVRFAARGFDDAGARLRVTWRAPRDTAAAEHDLGVVVTDSGAGALRLASVRTTPRPVWVDEAITVTAREATCLLAGDGVPVAEWLDAADLAVGDVAAQCPQLLAVGWDRSLVVVVPARLASFADALGVGQDAYRDVAAVSWAEQPADTGPMRVYVNYPLCRDLAAIDRRVLLAHEATHVATRRTLTRAPHWLSEGLAERVGLVASPGHRSRNADLARRFARAATSSPDLPADEEFEPGAGTDLATVYALSEQAVAALFARAGDEAAATFCRAAGGGEAWPIPAATVTAWYRERLADL